MIRPIDSIHFHVWSDALHAHQLAQQTQSDWDRGAYVRWTIQTAWSAFESVCADALEIEGLGMRFKERFNDGVAAKKLPPVDWGKGLWQRVGGVYDVRKEFAHVVPGISQERLKTPLSEADAAISVLRDGIKAVSDLVGVPHPPWINEAGIGGPQHADKLLISENIEGCVVRPGVREDHPDAVRIAWVLRGKETFVDVLAPGTPHGPLLDDLLKSLMRPVDAVRAYRGTELLEDRPTNMRT